MQQYNEDSSEYEASPPPGVEIRDYHELEKRQLILQESLEYLEDEILSMAKRKKDGKKPPRTKIRQSARIMQKTANQREKMTREDAFLNKLYRQLKRAKTTENFSEMEAIFKAIDILKKTKLTEVEDIYDEDTDDDVELSEDGEEPSEGGEEPSEGGEEPSEGGEEPSEGGEEPSEGGEEPSEGGEEPSEGGEEPSEGGEEPSEGGLDDRDSDNEGSTMNSSSDNVQENNDPEQGQFMEAP